jgi:hypothetical protein
LDNWLNIARRTFCSQDGLICGLTGIGLMPTDLSNSVIRHHCGTSL